MCSAKFPIVCKDNPLHQKGFGWECQSFLFHWKIFFFHFLKAQLSEAQKNLIFAIVMLSFKLCIWRHTNYIKGCLTICKQFLQSQYLQLISSKITRVGLWWGERNLKFFPTEIRSTQLLALRQKNIPITNNKLFLPRQNIVKTAWERNLRGSEKNRSLHSTSATFYIVTSTSECQKMTKTE